MIAVFFLFRKVFPQSLEYLLLASFLIIVTGLNKHPELLP